MKPGTLYLCATPIGNLEDMTYRGVRVLRDATAIAAEDTRHTRKLLSHFDIHTPLISYHEHNKAARGPELIERLLGGDTIAVVSDAGVPGISDPGADLVKLAVAAGIPVSPVPGANAAIAGLVVSGLDTGLFLFAGFLPRVSKKRRELLGNLAGLPFTLVFYESPHRLVATLAELASMLGDRQAAVGRELTKKFEEIARGRLRELADKFSATAPRGEITLVVAGCEKGPAVQEPVDPASAVYELVAAGEEKKEAIRLVASRLGLPKRDVYQAVLERSRQD